MDFKFESVSSQKLLGLLQNCGNLILLGLSKLGVDKIEVFRLQFENFYYLRYILLTAHC